MLSKIDKVIKKVDKLMLKATCEDSEETQAKILAKARLLLNKELVDNPENAELNHMLGLCWYFEPNRTKEAEDCMEHCFTKVSNGQNNEVEFASLYLGHFYFDKGRYNEALRLFLKANENYFENLDQKWRVLKNRELILCCKLYLSQEVTQEEVNSFCTLYEATELVEYGSAPLPQEILSCLVAIINQYPSNLKDVVYRVLQMVKNISFHTANRTKDNYSFLQQFLIGSQ